MNTNQNDNFDICIIGGGASGMAAAISCRINNPDVSICILEKNDKLGRKLYATGNGRCNLSNINATDVDIVTDFFANLGLDIVEENEGRLYPASNQAEDVVYCMELFLNNNSINILVNHIVEDVSRDEHYIIKTQSGTITARQLVLATGGKAAPEFGTIGDGYKYARKLGHTVTKTYPVLTAVEGFMGIDKTNTKENISSSSNESILLNNKENDWYFELNNIKGVRVKCTISLEKNNETIFNEYGEMQILKDGISGICVMNSSRYLKLDSNCNFDDYYYKIDLVPHKTEEQLVVDIINRLERGNDPLRSLIPSKLCMEIIKTLETIIVDFNQRNNKEKAKILAMVLKNILFKVNNVKGWKQAQCTGGGVALDEINLETMESKLVEGLFVIGEVTDFDEKCGGYNLNNAFLGGIKCGKALANKSSY